MKYSNILAEELAENSNVQDAFVIAVEQQARERLEKLSALRKIKPVDMTTLSQQLCDSDTNSREADVVVEKDLRQEKQEMSTEANVKPTPGSKSIYSAPLSEIGSSSNLQNGNVLKLF